MQRLSALLPYLRRHPVKLVSGLLCIAVAVSLSLAVPVVVGRAVDTLRSQFSSRSLVEYAALLVAITLVQGVFSFSQRRILVGMSRDIEFDIRDSYFAHLERLSQRFFHGMHTGDLMARGTNDLQAVRMLCGPAIMYSTNTLLTAIGALFFMTRINYGLTLLALSTLPLVAIATKTFGQNIHRHFQQVQEQFSEISTQVQESLAGVRVLRAYAQEASNERRFGELNLDYIERNRRLIRWTAAFHPLLHGLIGIGFVAVLWRGGSLVAGGVITVGEFVTFTFFLSRLVWPMIAIGWVINLVQRGSASLERLLEVLEHEPEIKDLPGCARPAIAGAVSCRNLTFAYRADLPPALREIDFEVDAGATVAVVGRTGAGKSTLLALLCRLWEPPLGALLIDGIDVRRICLESLRSAIAVVPQETFLFSASVADNITFGLRAASSEDLAAVVRVAGLEEDLAMFPQGLETVVGERGITLSGGQKQRVALARALLRRPRLLLLDDCLSAVDTHTEESILGNLKTELAGRTAFVVSHRISSIQRADLIVVLERGAIAERGTHQELLAADGIYADLHRRQQLEEELAEV